ncbi:MAG: primosomal protein N' [Thermotoga sp.]|nr:MAG: primosomal protein N' [Thermotoga sp.]
MYAQIAIMKINVNQTFVYAIPDELRSVIKVGHRVYVSLGTRMVVGYVVALSETLDEEIKKNHKILSIIDIVEEEPLLEPADIKLANLIADYYAAPIGKVLDMFLPPSMKLRNKDIIEVLQPDGNWFTEKGRITKKEFEKRFKSKRRALQILRSLQNTGNIKISTQFSVPRLKKIVLKRVHLIVSLKDAMNYMERVKGYKKQKQLIETLLAHDSIYLAGRYKRLLPAATSLEKKGIVKITSEEIEETQLPLIYSEKRAKIILNEEQRRAVKKISACFAKDKKGAVMIEGVTGSGKTEVYFEVMEMILKVGKSVLFLVPEIGLTVQMLARIKNRFPEYRIGVYHSTLTPHEKFREWLYARQGKTKILVGTRSAVFLGIKGLSMIVMDEGQDTSYYQGDQNPYYDAFRVASWKCKTHNVNLLLGSATPAVEDYYEFLADDRITHLHSRPLSTRLPDVEIVDMRKEKGVMISKRVYEGIDETLNDDKQCVIFLNRKGFARYVICRDCGYVPGCPNCGISLTYYRKNRFLQCNYCGYIESVPKQCPHCGGMNISISGYGTERVEMELNRAFPDRVIVRADSDTIKDHRDFEKVMEGMRDKHIEILVGTQMIAKGIDFPNIGLVSILDADSMLNIPDFHSQERTFQLIDQVSGRGGRSDISSKVLIQTYTPDSPIIKFALNHDYDGFFHWEIEQRQRLHYPPFSTLIQIVWELEDPTLCNSVAEGVADELKGKKEVILGPSDPFIPKKEGKFRKQILIKTNDVKESLKKLDIAMNDVYKKFPFDMKGAKIRVSPKVII